MQPTLVEQIYEAAAIPDLWPNILQGLGKRFATKGGLLFSSSDGGVRWLGGGEVTAVMSAYVAEGWGARNPRPAKVIELNRPGFVTDLDIMTEEETHTHPLFRDFLRPHGCFATAGTFVRGLNEDLLILSIEGFASHDAARRAVPELDTLRPHLARSAQLAGQFKLERIRGYVEALEAIGAAACVLSPKGRLHMANKRFEAELGLSCRDAAARLQLRDKKGDALLVDTLARIGAGEAFGRSIALRQPNGPARVLHVLPIVRQANDLFIGALALLILTNPETKLEVSPDLLGGLFDLTPAEVRLAAHVCSAPEMELPQVASLLGVSLSTVKTHLRSIFQKTGTHRQADLVSLLVRAHRI